MPLKILLADDSSTIKKVVQISLQDFGAEVRSISSGKDVIDVARNFAPDIAFIDVLLPHKTGYEVAQEMKKDSALRNVPVVMMWSAFMSLDEGKFKESGADDRLEKPFEVSGLRALINKYVSKTQNNPISKHIEFPKIDFDDGKIVKTTSSVEKDSGVSAQSGSAGGWNMSSFEDVSQFAAKEAGSSSVSSGDVPPSGQKTAGWPDETEWVQKDISKFRVNIPDEGLEEPMFSSSEPAPQTPPAAESRPEPVVSQPQQTQPLLKPLEEITEITEVNVVMAQPAPKNPPPLPRTPQPEPAVAAPAMAVTSAEVSLDNAEIREFISKEVERLTREVLEKIVWQSVPDIATNLIKEELKRLLDTENPLL